MTEATAWLQASRMTRVICSVAQCHSRTLPSSDPAQFWHACEELCMK